MLHFLIGVAVCIWIAERVARFLENRRQKRNFQRGLKLLSPETQAEYANRIPTPARGRWIASAIVAVGVLLVIAVIASP